MEILDGGDLDGGGVLNIRLALRECTRESHGVTEPQLPTDLLGPTTSKGGCKVLLWDIDFRITSRRN
jgi:hypothetical protein